MKPKYVALLLLAGLTLFGSASQEAWKSYFDRADQALLAANYQDAIGYYYKGIFLAPSDVIPRIWDDLAYANLQTRSLIEAIKYCQKALTVYPRDYDLHLYLALAYMLYDDPRRAGQELMGIEQRIRFGEGWVDEALGLQPKNERGEALSREQLERLRKEKGVGLFPDDHSSLTVVLFAFDERNEGLFDFLRGLVDAGAGDQGKAEEMFQAAIKAGCDPEVVRLGRTQPAKELPFRVHHRIREHGYALARALHEKCLKQLEGGKIVEAVLTLREALEAYRQSFELNFNAALLSYDINDLDQAEISCARALWFKDGDHAAHELMGNIYFSREAYARALFEFQRVVEIDGNNAAGHFNLGSAYSQMGDTARAETHWKLAAASTQAGANGEKPEPAENKGLFYSSLVKKNPVAQKAHIALGKLYSGQGRPEPAIQEFEAAVRLKPDDPEPYGHLGRLYLERKDTTKAEACLKKYLYLGGKDEDEAKRLLDSIEKR